MTKSVAELVDHLFRTRTKEHGKEFSYQEVSAALKGEISPAYISKLRHGQITNPGRHALLLLCTFFKVPASYFFPELDELVEEPSEDERIAIALRSSSLPEEVRNHIEGLIKAIRKQQQE